MASTALATTGVAIADAETKPPSVFSVDALEPGQTVHGAITVPGAAVPVSPYLRIHAIQQHCLVATCADSASLASMLTMTVTAPNGATWRGALTALKPGIDLPGGLMAAGHDRTYRMLLSLPARAGNQYEALAISAELDWGGRDDDGHAVTPVGPGTSTHLGSDGGGDSTPSVLGEHLLRPQRDDSLPFTGLDALVLVAAASGSLVTGLAFTAVARRVRPGPVTYRQRW
jgi:hypothetical protein